MLHARFAVGAVTVYLSVDVAHITPGPALESLVFICCGSAHGGLQCDAAVGVFVLRCGEVVVTLLGCLYFHCR